MSRPLLLTLALAATLPAFAATPINETRPLDPTGHVEIANIKGRIDVQAWDRPEVKIEGSLGKGVEKLEIEGDRRHLVVRVKYPQRFGMLGNDRSEPTELRLMVPLRAGLEIDSVAADVGVQGVGGNDLDIDSVSGDVTVVGAPRKATFNSVSGDQTLTINTNDVNIDSVSGDVILRGRLGGEVKLSTVSGDFSLASNPESLIRELSGSSVSGDMRLATALAKGGEIALESVSGDLHLKLPRDLSARARGESFSGDLNATGAQIDKPKHGPGSSFEHRYGNGDGSITIETFSGNARLQVD